MNNQQQIQLYFKNNRFIFIKNEKKPYTTYLLGLLKKYYHKIHLTLPIIL